MLDLSSATEDELIMLLSSNRVCNISFTILIRSVDAVSTTLLLWDWKNLICWSFANDYICSIKIRWLGSRRKNFCSISVRSSFSFSEINTPSDVITTTIAVLCVLIVSIKVLLSVIFSFRISIVSVVLLVLDHFVVGFVKQNVSTHLIYLIVF